jgi:hypothetical protein
MMGEAAKMKYLTRFFVTVNPLFVQETFSTGKRVYFRTSFPSSYSGSTLALSLVRQ